MRAFEKTITHCPFCGVAYTKKSFRKNGHVFVCASCHISQYLHAAPAAAIIIPLKEDPFKVYMTIRNIEPHKGKVDMVGGFLNYNEVPYDAAIREAKEEVGVKITPAYLLDAVITPYNFKGVVYQTLVLYYVAKPITQLPKHLQEKEVSRGVIVNLKRPLIKSKFAFANDYKMLQAYKKLIK